MQGDRKGSGAGWARTPGPLRRRWLGFAAVPLLFAGAGPAGPAHAAPRLSEPAMSQAFAEVTSRAAARRLATRGVLVPIHIFPQELGGPDDPENISYVPPAAAAALARVTAKLRKMAAQGLVDRMEAEPDYRGASFVPTRIRFKAWHSRKAGSFVTGVEIW